MNKKKSARTIAPRLADGRSRVPDYGRLPPAIKDGLRKIARMEKRSMSWVKEEVIIRYFKMERPRYVSDNKKRNS
jgi:hypothetical protein